MKKLLGIILLTVLVVFSSCNSNADAFLKKIACSSATVEPTGCLFSSRIPNQFRNLVIQAVCLDQFLQRDVHPVSPIMV